MKKSSKNDAAAKVQVSPEQAEKQSGPNGEQASRASADSPGHTTKIQTDGAHQSAPAMTPQSLNRRRLVAFHEAGHAVVAWHYGFYCWAHIWRLTGKLGDLWEGEARPKRRDSHWTYWGDPVLTWAGMIAERLVDGSRFRRRNLRDIRTRHSDLKVQLLFSSEGDYHSLERAGYLNYKPLPKMAGRILDARYDQLCEAAKVLEATGYLPSQVPYPGLPTCWSAE